MAANEPVKPETKVLPKYKYKFLYKSDVLMEVEATDADQAKAFILEGKGKLSIYPDVKLHPGSLIEISKQEE